MRMRYVYDVCFSVCAVEPNQKANKSVFKFRRMKICLNQVIQIEAIKRIFDF